MVVLGQARWTPRTRLCLALCCPSCLIRSDLPWGGCLVWERWGEGESWAVPTPSPPLPGPLVVLSPDPSRRPSCPPGTWPEAEGGIGGGWWRTWRAFQGSWVEESQMSLAQEEREVVAEEGKGKVGENPVGLSGSFVLSESSRL